MTEADRANRHTAERQVSSWSKQYTSTRIVVPLPFPRSTLTKPAPRVAPAGQNAQITRATMAATTRKAPITAPSVSGTRATLRSSFSWDVSVGL